MNPAAHYPKGDNDLLPSHRYVRCAIEVNRDDEYAIVGFHADTVHTP